MQDLELAIFNDAVLEFSKKVSTLKLQLTYGAQSLEPASLEPLNTQWVLLKQQYKHLLSYGYQRKNGKKRIDPAAEIDAMEKLLDQLTVSTLPGTWQPIILLQKLEEAALNLQNGWVLKNHKDAFLVNLWTWLLKACEKVSLFYVIRQYLFKNYTQQNYRFVDCWLLFHTILAISYVFIANSAQVPIGVKYGLLIYGCLRMFEILIYQLNVILVHPYNNQNYALNSYRRMTIALIHNFIEIIFWFAGTFVILQFITDTSVPRAVYTSFTHMVTYSMELDDSKWTLLAIFILQFQAAIGVFMTVLSLARFVSLFPQPASLDPKEQEANEVRHALLLQQFMALKATVEANHGRISEIEKQQDE